LRTYIARSLKSQRKAGPLDPGGHVVRDPEFWVNSLRENAKENSLTSLKLEQPKRMIVVSEYPEAPKVEVVKGH
jgi:hypothetical protein